MQTMYSNLYGLKARKNSIVINVIMTLNNIKILTIFSLCYNVAVNEETEKKNTVQILVDLVKMKTKSYNFHVKFSGIQKSSILYNCTLFLYIESMSRFNVFLSFASVYDINDVRKAYMFYMLVTCICFLICDCCVFGTLNRVLWGKKCFFVCLSFYTVAKRKVLFLIKHKHEIA